VAVQTRTCVGCRQAVPAQTLVRLALCAGEVVLVAPRGARPSGRGAWLHAREACVRAALKTRAFDRAFRARVAAPDADRLWAAVQGLGAETHAMG
jgi:uncharacterized protein